MKRLLLVFTISVILISCSNKNDKSVAYETFNQGVSFSLDAVEEYEKGNYEQSEELNNKAIEKFLETLRIDSTHKATPSALGHSYYLVRNFGEAIKWFEKAVEIDSSFAVNYRELGLCRVNKGDISGGMKEIQKAFQLDSSEEMKQMTVLDLMDIGLLAFDYGNAYEDQGENETGLNYKQFAVYVLISAHQIDSTNNEIVNYIVDFAEKIGYTEIVENYKNNR